MISRIAWLPAALLAASAVGAAPAPEPKDADQTRIIPGGVADADGAKGFVADDKGGVSALDLESGKVLWESKTAGRPIAVEGGRVLVQTRDPKNPQALRIVGLDVDKGDKAWESDPIVFPDWVSPVEGRGAGRSFHSHARLDDGALLIIWQANSFYWGGAAPSPQIIKASTRHADGAARIHLESGKVEMLDAAKAPPPAGPKVSKELEKAAARSYGPDGSTVAVAGDYAVAVDVEPAGADKQKVVLKRWDLTTEKPLDPMILAEGGVYQVVTQPSAGVALVHALPAPGGAQPMELAWTAYALETGKAAGQFTTEPGATDFTVVGPCVFYVVRGPFKGPRFGGVIPRTLKAVDLKSGKPLWEQPLEGERLPPPPPP